MSVEAPIRESDNWFIGEDKTLTFYVTTGEDVEVSETVASGATSIPVEALKEALSSGDKVRFMRDGANVVATLTASAAVGATSLTVSALAGGILVGTAGRKIQDCTGYTLQWKLREGPTATSELLSKAGTVTDGPNGVCTVTIADTDTVDASGNILINPGDYYHTLRKTDAGDESVLAYGLAVLRLAGTR